MIIVGLTGSIATGKTFVANCFAKFGAAIFDADRNVHEILNSENEASKEIYNEFPQAYVNGKIDRQTLGKIVFNDDLKRKKLENIIYPILDEKRDEFLQNCRENNINIVVLEIPLLFENDRHKMCDYVVVTSVDKAIQQKRALEREGMTIEKFNSINNLQMDSAEKIKKADFVIDTGLSEFSVYKEVKSIINSMCDNDTKESES